MCGWSQVFLRFLFSRVRSKLGRGLAVNTALGTVAFRGLNGLRGRDFGENGKNLDSAACVCRLDCLSDTRSL